MYFCTSMFCPSKGLSQETPTLEPNPINIPNLICNPVARALLILLRRRFFFLYFFLFPLQRTKIIVYKSCDDLFLLVQLEIKPCGLKFQNSRCLFLELQNRIKCEKLEQQPYFCLELQQQLKNSLFEQKRQINQNFGTV